MRVNVAACTLRTMAGRRLTGRTCAGTGQVASELDYISGGKEVDLIGESARKGRERDKGKEKATVTYPLTEMRLGGQERA